VAARPRRRPPQTAGDDRRQRASQEETARRAAPASVAVRLRDGDVFVNRWDRAGAAGSLARDRGPTDVTDGPRSRRGEPP
jgi:hypothetical protein